MVPTTMPNNQGVVYTPVPIIQNQMQSGMQNMQFGYMGGQLGLNTNGMLQGMLNPLQYSNNNMGHKNSKEERD